MKPKVVWTQREWGLVAQWFVDHDVNPKDYGFVTAFRKAQEAVLPPDRQRCTIGLTSKTKQDLVLVIQNLPKAKPEAARPPEPPRAEVLSTEELLVELARRIARLLEPKSESSLVDRGFHPPRKHDPNPPREVRTAKIKVLVIGPRGSQQERLRTAFPMLDLRFVLAEELPSLVMTRSADCREIILWTKFMNHAQQTAAQNTGIDTWYANGLEEIEARLRSLHG